MTTNTKPVYKRVLLELSGEALQDIGGFGIDASILDCMAQEIKGLVELSIQVGMVISKGNLFHGADLTEAGMNHIVDSHMGIPATIMNGLAVCDVLHRAYANVRLMSAIPLNGVCDSYSWAEAISLLRNNRVVILSAGISNPFLTTNSAACLRGIKIEADVVLKAIKASGASTAGSAKDPAATMYEQLTYNEALEKELKAMDLAAFALVRNHKLPIHAFNINKPGTLRRVVMGEKGRILIME